MCSLLTATLAVAPKIELESVAHHYLNNMFKYESGNDAAALAKASNPECFGCSGDCNVNMVCEAGQVRSPTRVEQQIPIALHCLRAGWSDLCQQHRTEPSGLDVCRTGARRPRASSAF